MKKYMIVLILSLVVIVGCVNYKAYDVPTDSKEDLSLVDEIAAIEKEIAATEQLDEPVIDEPIVEEDIIIPELTDDMDDDISTELQTISVKESELVKLNVDVSDPDADPVTYTFSAPLDQNGKWQTNYGDAGEYIVTIIASDGVLTSEKKIRVVVERVNVPPTIELVNNILVAEGKLVTFEPVVADPNGDPVTVDVSEPLKSGSFQTDHTSSGEYNIKIMASDGELSTEAGFLLTVTDVNELPVISNLEDITVAEGKVVKIKPIVTDLDEDEIILTISDPVGNDGIWETSFTDNGEYVVTIKADDGKNVVTKKVRIVVTDVNMPPEIIKVELSS